LCCDGALSWSFQPGEGRPTPSKGHSAAGPQTQTWRIGSELAAPVPRATELRDPVSHAVPASVKANRECMSAWKCMGWRRREIRSPWISLDALLKVLGGIRKAHSRLQNREPATEHLGAGLGRAKVGSASPSEAPKKPRPKTTVFLSSCTQMMSWPLLFCCSQLRLPSIGTVCDRPGRSSGFRVHGVNGKFDPVRTVPFPAP
jgi:hypothetical protein